MKSLHNILLKNRKIDNAEYGEKKTARNREDAGGSSSIYVLVIVIHAIMLSLSSKPQPNEQGYKASTIPSCPSCTSDQS